MIDEKIVNIYARHCQLKSIGRDEAFDFLEANHRLGFAKSRYYYGLYLNSDHYSITKGSLVAVATFSKSRRWIKEDKEVFSYEWVRYACLSGYRVVGGMSKILSNFIKEVNPDDIMTYIDPRFNNGVSYEKLGFVRETEKVFENGNLSIKFRLKILG